MPKSVATPRAFITLISRSDAKWVKVKKNITADGAITKFKLRTTKYLYTLSVNTEKLEKLVLGSIPPNLEIIYIDQKKQ